MASLKILSGSLSGQTVELGPDPSHIGRASQNDIRINDPGVSSRHAKIWCEGERWFLMDLGSTNGTLVNNADIDREEIRPGDKIAFGPVMAVFEAEVRRAPVISNPRRAAVPAPSPRSAPPQRPISSPAHAVPGLSGDRAAELELELSTLRARYATLEKELDRVRSEATAAQQQAAAGAASSVRGEMEKLRELMRERDESMRSLEAQIREREAYYSPEEMERERKRIEASVALESRRAAEAYERQIKELEGRMVARAAEAEALSRTVREKDELIRMLSDREDRTGGALREKDDRIAEISGELKKQQEEIARFGSREKELEEKLRQKNDQLADMGRRQAELTQEVTRAKSVLSKLQAGDSTAAAELASADAAELESARKEVIQLQQQLGSLKDELITARSQAEQEAARTAQTQETLDVVQGQLTDLSDDKAKLAAQVDELMRKHSEVAEAERRCAGMEAEAGQLREREEESRQRAEKAEAEAVALRQERMDLEALRDALQKKLDDLEADYRVLKASRDSTFDWEARYKSQQEDFESMRRENAMLREQVEALDAQVAATASGADDLELVQARSRGAVLEEMAGGMLEGVNNAVSLLRRNAEVLKGYVHDCGLLANCVRQINYTRLEPDQQQMLRELIDETQPDIIINNMEGIGEENAEATHRAKRLILDYQDAMKGDEDGTDLERCFAKSQGLVEAVDPGTEVRVKVTRALPPLACPQPDAVLFTYALLREAKKLAVDEDQAPTIRVDVDGSTITLQVAPLAPAAKDRYRETRTGGGDALSQYVYGFATKACAGRVDVKDLGEATTMFVTLSAEGT